MIVVRIQSLYRCAIRETLHLNRIAVFVRRRHDKLNTFDEGDSEVILQRLDVFLNRLFQFIQWNGVEPLIIDRHLCRFILLAHMEPQNTL